MSCSLITSKTKVAPKKRLLIPRLELCGAVILAKLIHHLMDVFFIPSDKVHAWMDSTVVLSWIVGNPRRFKTFVGNRVSELISLIPPNSWRHMKGDENPADCASRGLMPSQLIELDLWWNGLAWLYKGPSSWPNQSFVKPRQTTRYFLK